MLFQSSKLEGLFSLNRGKRDVRASSFELSKMSPQVGLAVSLHVCGESVTVKYMYVGRVIYVSLSNTCSTVKENQFLQFMCHSPPLPVRKGKSERELL